MISDKDQGTNIINNYLVPDPVTCLRTRMSMCEAIPSTGNAGGGGYAIELSRSMIKRYSNRPTSWTLSSIRWMEEIKLVGQSTIDSRLNNSPESAANYSELPLDSLDRFLAVTAGLCAPHTRCSSRRQRQSAWRAITYGRSLECRKPI